VGIDIYICPIPGALTAKISEPKKIILCHVGDDTDRYIRDGRKFLNLCSSYVEISLHCNILELCCISGGGGGSLGLCSHRYCHLIGQKNSFAFWNLYLVLFTN